MVLSWVTQSRPSKHRMLLGLLVSRMSASVRSLAGVNCFSESIFGGGSGGIGSGFVREF